MKFIAILVFLTIFSCAVSSNETEPFRQFLTNFFQTVNGTQWTLNEDCLAGASDADVEKIVAAYQAHDYITALFYLNDLKRVLVSSCPLQDLSQVGHELGVAITSGRIATNVLTNYMEIITLLNEVLPHIREYELPQIGTFLGRFYNVVILGHVHNIEFLAYAYSPLESNPTEFLVGFIEGSSEVAYDQNQCIKNSESFLPELAHSVEAIWEAISTRHGIKDAFVQFMETASTRLNGVESNCHFVSLATTFLTLSNPVLLAKIAYRITTDILNIIDIISNIKQANSVGNTRDIGRGVGRLFHIIFLYSTQ